VTREKMAARREEMRWRYCQLTLPMVTLPLRAAIPIFFDFHAAVSMPRHADVYAAARAAADACRDKGARKDDYFRHY
jgi:hypothetical protein